MPDRHTTWDCVGVDHKVRAESALGKRHIFLRCDKSDNSFLTVTGCKLVADFRDTEVTGAHFDQTGAVLTFGNDHSIDNTVLVAAHRN